MANVDALFNAIADNPMATSPFWQNLYYDHIYSQNDPDQDDLLFYVTTDDKKDPIFVRRKTEPNSMLTEEESLGVKWKETFFLNFIVQLPFQLTVAVCHKTITAEGKSAMTAIRHVTKRVYASPNKTRMDKKGHDYVVSYPLVYFMVEDFEDAFANIVINENEYFCIELFVMLPPRRDLQTGSLIGGERKVVVFQGAVNWEALSSTFLRQAAQSLRDRIEYIMMRGPRGKGHAQVAVSTPSASPPSSASSSSSSLQQSPSAELRAGLMRGFAKLQQAFGAKQEPITQLKCWLTFVNVSWQSLINDVATVALRDTGKSKVPEVEPSKSTESTSNSSANA